MAILEDITICCHGSVHEKRKEMGGRFLYFRVVQETPFCMLSHSPDSFLYKTDIIISLSFQKV